MKKVVSLFLVTITVLSIFSINAFAACTHRYNTFTNYYSMGDSTYHKKRVSKTCTKCGHYVFVSEGTGLHNDSNRDLKCDMCNQGLTCFHNGNTLDHYEYKVISSWEHSVTEYYLCDYCGNPFKTTHVTQESHKKEYPCSSLCTLCGYNGLSANHEETVIDHIEYTNGVYKHTEKVFEKCTVCGEIIESASEEKNHFDEDNNGTCDGCATSRIAVNTTMHLPNSYFTVGYNESVSILLKADNLPEGYRLCVYIGNYLYKESDTGEILFVQKNVTQDVLCKVAVVNEKGQEVIGSRGSLISTFKIKCNDSFFGILAGFFKKLFGMLKTVEIPTHPVNF